MLTEQTKNLKVLDCTLRDGGYYNNWCFSEDLVQSYFKAVEEANIDIVEIGLRSTPKSRFLGPYAYTTDRFLEGLTALPRNTTLCVMVNASDLIQHPSGPSACIDDLFQTAENSPVSLVRIAAHLREVEKALPAVERLHQLGYEIGFNIMQASNCSDDELSASAALIESWKTPQVLYFADSLGNMDEKEITRVFNAFRKEWSGDIGIHTHDNMGLGLQNSMTALKLGTNWLDCTILGMGRGAGNTASETLLMELSENGVNKYAPEALFPIAAGGFQELKNQYQWGESLFYRLAAKYAIHPTYVQQMLADELYTPQDILTVLNSLKDEAALSFSTASLQAAMHRAFIENPGSQNVSDWAQNKTVLVLAAGDETQNHKTAIEQFVKEKSPLVISINHNSAIEPELIDAYIACHPTRIRASLDFYSTTNKTLIAPKGTLSEQENAQLKDTPLLDYGMEVKTQSLQVNANNCVVPYPLASAYALSFCIAAGASRIYLCGFDGYPQGDTRNNNINEIFNLFKQHKGNPEIVALTPTQYNIEQASIYQPGL